MNDNTLAFDKIEGLAQLKQILDDESIGNLPKCRALKAAYEKGIDISQVCSLADTIKELTDGEDLAYHSDTFGVQLHEQEDGSRSTFFPSGLINFTPENYKIYGRILGQCSESSENQFLSIIAYDDVLRRIDTKKIFPHITDYHGYYADVSVAYDKTGYKDANFEFEVMADYKTDEMLKILDQMHLLTDDEKNIFESEGWDIGSHVSGIKFSDDEKKAIFREFDKSGSLYFGQSPVDWISTQAVLEESTDDYETFDIIVRNNALKNPNVKSYLDSIEITIDDLQKILRDKTISNLNKYEAIVYAAEHGVDCKDLPVISEDFQFAKLELRDYYQNNNNGFSVELLEDDLCCNPVLLYRMKEIDIPQEDEAKARAIMAYWDVFLRNEDDYIHDDLSPCESFHFHIYLDINIYGTKVTCCENMDDAKLQDDMLQNKQLTSSERKALSTDICCSEYSLPITEKEKQIIIQNITKDFTRDSGLLNYINADDFLNEYNEITFLRKENLQKYDAFAEAIISKGEGIYDIADYGDYHVSLSIECAEDNYLITVFSKVEETVKGLHIKGERTLGSVICSSEQLQDIFKQIDDGSVCLTDKKGNSKMLASLFEKAKYISKKEPDKE